MPIDPNAPAFPVTLHDGQTLGDGTANGMSIRCWLAGQAMAALISRMASQMVVRGANESADDFKKSRDEIRQACADNTASCAAAYADALIAELNKTP